MNWFIRSGLLLLLVVSRVALATPGDTLYYEDFESGAGGWSKTVGDPTYPTFGINAAFGYNAAYVAGEIEVRAESPTIDLSAVSGARVTITVIRGSNIVSAGTVLSNRPDTGENYELEYRGSDGNWHVVVSHSGGNPSGEVFNDVVDLPADAMHSGFKLRVGTFGGDAWDGAPDDFWHFDDVKIIETSAAGGDLGSCTLGVDFDSGSGGFSLNGAASLSTLTYASSGQSLRLPSNGSNAVSPVIDLAGKTATIGAWVRAGGWGGGPDKPESSDHLEFEYLDASSSWNTLEVFCNGCGNGTAVDAGGVFTFSGNLPTAALHSNFQLRLVNTSNNTSSTLDNWFVDNLCITATSPVDHFAIIHDGSGVNCQAEPIEVRAHAADHSVAQAFTGTIALSDSTSHGDWSAAVAAGTLSNGGSGAASYAFVSADKGKVTLKLADTFAETTNFAISDGLHTEAASEDPDLVFSATGFQFVAAGTSLPVGNQISGKPSNLAPANAIELQAIRSSDVTGACEAAFVGSTAVELAMSCESPSVCAGVSGSINGSNIATGGSGSPASWTTMIVDFGDNNDTTAPVVFQYDDAGSVKLHARKALSPSGELLAGSSATIVVRPFGLDVSVDQGSITNINPAASGPGGIGFETAGDPFRVTVRAVGWSSVDDSNSDGIPDGHDDSDPGNNADLSDNVALPNFAKESSPDTVSLAVSLLAPLGGTNPGLSGYGPLSGFVSGLARRSSLRWQNVGIIEISADITDSSYQGAGAVPGRSGHVGRFIAHHLGTEVVHHGCSDTAAFGFERQAIAELQIKAYSENGTVASNFSWDSGSGTGFAKDIALSDAAVTPQGTFSTGVSKMDFSSGVASISDNISFSFMTSPHVPYPLGIHAVDGDSAASLASSEGGTEIRTGRLRITTAAAPLNKPAFSKLESQRWNGSSWDAETDDSCSASVLGMITYSYGHFMDALDSGESLMNQIQFDMGQGTARFSAPGIGNAGRMDATPNLPTWLEADWGGGSLADPVGVVLFLDIFPSESGFINKREIIP